MKLFALPDALLPLVSSVLLLLGVVKGDVEFTVPAPGADVPVGTIAVQWKESGIAPPITSLGAYSLILMTGGNENSNMLPLSTFVSQGNFRSTGPVSGTIPAGIAEAATNGFFFKIITSSPTGAQVINYSSRFTIKGLTGYTPPQYLSAAKALSGSTNGPSPVGETSSSSLSTSAPTTATTTSTVSAPSTVKSAVIVSASGVLPHNPVGTTTVDTGGRKSSGSSISTGALVGIAIAGAVVGLIGMGLALFACLRWRKRQSTPDELKLPDDTTNTSHDHLRREMSYAESAQTPVELDPYATIVEAGDGAQRAEMDSNNVRCELEGDVQWAPMHDFGPPLTPVPSTPIENLTLDSQACLALRATEKEQV